MRLRRWFLRHWFAAVLLVIGGLWGGAVIAYLAGAEEVSFRNRYTGQDARIDFGREHDRTVLALGDGIGLQLDARGLSGSVVKVETGLPLVFCWICGELATAGGIAMVDHRQGDWFFRAPRDESRNHEARHGRRPESRSYILTIAYNRVTEERIQHAADTTIEAQAAMLAARGLAATTRTRLTPSALTDLEELSMQREGCVVFNAAFLAVALLWLLLGSLVLGIRSLARRARR